MSAAPAQGHATITPPLMAGAVVLFAFAAVSAPAARMHPMPELECHADADTVAYGALTVAVNQSGFEQGYLEWAVAHHQAVSSISQEVRHEEAPARELTLQAHRTRRH